MEDEIAISELLAALALAASLLVTLVLVVLVLVIQALVALVLCGSHFAIPALVILVFSCCSYPR